MHVKCPSRRLWRGFEGFKKLDKKILVDWLTCTIGIQCFLRDFAHIGTYCKEEEHSSSNAIFYADENLLSKLYEFLGLPQDSPFKIKNGRYGYAKEYNLGGIRIAFGNCDTIMFDLSGEGCRLLETLVSSLNWLELIKRIEQFQRHNFSRLDIACDTVGGLKMSALLRYSLEGLYISRWKSLPRIVQGREETIDFGSPQSRTMLRIYNKTLERKCKVDEDVEVPEGWVRCELQLRNDAVDSFVREWKAYGDISAVYLGIMANHLRFVKERSKSETNLSRLQTVKWWRDFLDNSNPIRLAYKGGLAYNLQSLERYVYGQAGSSMKTWLVLHNWDVDTMLKMVAPRRMNDRQEALVKTMASIQTVSTVK